MEPCRRQNWFAIDQHHVAADTQLRQLLSHLSGLAECRPIGHQCGGCDDSIRVRLNDGAIYARCEPEIVGINNEAPHSASLAEGIASPCGILHSLIARLLFENEQEGSTI